MMFQLVKYEVIVTDEGMLTVRTCEANNGEVHGLGRLGCAQKVERRLRDEGVKRYVVW